MMAIFNQNEDWIVCEQQASESLSEIRTNAFASHLLLPVQGVQRYLRSMGRGTESAGVLGVAPGALLELNDTARQALLGLNGETGSD